MAKSRDTFDKKEKEKLRQKKKQEKQQKKDDRKSQTSRSTGFEDMIAYVDEFGNITSTPPDPSKKKIFVDVDSIEIGVAKHAEPLPGENLRKGKVTFFNESKGYGFIKDEVSQESIFVHINKCIDLIQENDKVTFETEKSPKGLSAVDVKLFKAP